MFGSEVFYAIRCLVAFLKTMFSKPWFSRYMVFWSLENSTPTQSFHIMTSCFLIPWFTLLYPNNVSQNYGIFGAAKTMILS
jgi:hypothetical protein